jgi:hypothetical protein
MFQKKEILIYLPDYTIWQTRSMQYQRVWLGNKSVLIASLNNMPFLYQDIP